jgi:hypothetical protein
LVAAQVIVVAALAALVYVNFLAPEAESPLTGVQAPGAPEPGQGRSTGTQRNVRADADRGSGAGAALAAVGPSVSSTRRVTPSAVSDSPGLPSSPGSTGNPGDQGPTGDQYLGALARLNARVR